MALTTAYALFRDRDAWLSPGRRTEILERAATIMHERAETLAVEAAREGGKPLIDSLVEVARAIDGVKLCIEALRTQAGGEIPMNLNAASANRIAFTLRCMIVPAVTEVSFPQAAHSQLARRRFSSQPLSWPQAGQTKPSGQRTPGVDQGELGMRDGKVEVERDRAL